MTEGAGHVRQAAALPVRRAPFGPFDPLADRAHGAYLAGRPE